MFVHQDAIFRREIKPASGKFASAGFLLLLAVWGDRYRNLILDNADLVCEYAGRTLSNWRLAMQVLLAILCPIIVTSLGVSAMSTAAAMQENKERRPLAAAIAVGSGLLSLHAMNCTIAVVFR